VRDLTLVASAPDARRPPHVAAASGLVLAGAAFLVVADDELSLAAFTRSPAEPGTLWPLRCGTLPAEAEARKAAKPDWEALVLLGGELLAVPSGSTSGRMRGAVLPLAGAAPAGDARPVDFAPLYSHLEAAVAPKGLNIEGACVRGADLLLFQRGNAASGCNAVVTLDLAATQAAIAARAPLPATLVRGVRRYDLGSLRGVPLGFTDAAACSDGGIVFLAAAEATSNAYDDAPVAGSVVGFMDRTGAVTAVHELVPAIKAEGLAVEATAGGRVLWIVSDGDDPAVPAGLYRVTA
jgi:hypothetical protein